ncbi:MAG: hypothetical protein KAH32_06555 [Chlamydiia bacterium]|nr:hypothetical protein [Chlamydiia bacterium]
MRSYLNEVTTRLVLPLLLICHGEASCSLIGRILGYDEFSWFGKHAITFKLNLSRYEYLYERSGDEKFSNIHKDLKVYHVISLQMLEIMTYIDRVTLRYSIQKPVTTQHKDIKMLSSKINKIIAKYYQPQKI